MDRYAQGHSRHNLGTTWPIAVSLIQATSLRQIGKLLSGVATKLGRELNPHVLSPEEFAKRRKTREHFITTVLSEPRLFVIGSEDELKSMGR